MVILSIIKWVFLGLVSLLGMIFSITAIQRKRSGLPMETKYRTSFILGAAILFICTLPSFFTGEPGLYGITITQAGVELKQFSGFSGFFGIIGLATAYMITSLANREKWAKHTEE